MTAEADVYSVLAVDTGVTGIVGERIFPQTRPQGESLPAVVYRRTSTEPAAILRGIASINKVAIQISSWAKTYQEAKTLSVAVKDALEDSDLKIRIVDDSDDFDEPTMEFRVIQDYRIWEK